jgi:carbon storage regulator
VLVLTRKCNEQIVLPELGVTITILDVRGDKVRVGVSAPSDAKVYRQEAWSQMDSGNGMGGPHANGHPAWGGVRAASGRAGVDAATSVR